MGSLRNTVALTDHLYDAKTKSLVWRGLTWTAGQAAGGIHNKMFA